MKYAHLASTKGTSIILCLLLSALMSMDLLKTLQIGGGSDSSTANGHGQHHCSWTKKEKHSSPSQIFLRMYMCSNSG